MALSRGGAWGCSVVGGVLPGIVRLGHHAALSAVPPSHREPELLVSDVGSVLRDDVALVDDEDAVGEREDLVELERDEQDRPPGVSLLDEAAVDELDGADVEPAGRLCGDQNARIAVDLPREDRPSADCRPRAPAGVSGAAAAHVEIWSQPARTLDEPRAGRASRTVSSAAPGSRAGSMFSAIEKSRTSPRRWRSSRDVTDPDLEALARCPRP